MWSVASSWVWQEHNTNRDSKFFYSYACGEVKKHGDYPKRLDNFRRNRVISFFGIFRSLRSMILSIKVFDESTFHVEKHFEKVVIFRPSEGINSNENYPFSEIK
jgi:hypothetical protein